MGLDIYLYRYENKEKTESVEAVYDSKSNANWDKYGEYESLKDDQKDLIREENKKIAVSLGLDESGEDPQKESIEINSSKYPDHYFKVGYFRSSYNDGGINRILSNLNLPRIDDIFSHEDEEYIFRPDWDLSLIKVRDVITRLKEAPNIRCFNTGWNEFKGSPSKATITNEGEAVKAFLEESSKHTDGFGDDGYSNIVGEFFPKGLKVLGLISGGKKRFFVDEVLPSTYVITEGENEWYVQALEIIEETILYVLDKPDKDKYFLHWSG
jgi:hypothetical protein